MLEANPNPQIARDEDFAQSAKHAGLDYEELLQQLLRFGIQREAMRPLSCGGAKQVKVPRRSAATRTRHPL
jgi:hypothetical protein